MPEFLILSLIGSFRNLLCLWFENTSTLSLLPLSSLGEKREKFSEGKFFACFISYSLPSNFPHKALVTTKSDSGVRPRFISVQARQLSAVCPVSSCRLCSFVSLPWHQLVGQATEEQEWRWVKREKMPYVPWSGPQLPGVPGRPSVSKWFLVWLLWDQNAQTDGITLFLWCVFTEMSEPHWLC